MKLKELIAELKKHPKKQKVALGFHNPHSYRGYYDCLAFEPKENTTVGEMLNAAKSALGNTYCGWKGGEYTMTGDTECYLANMGCIGEEIDKTLLELMLKENNEQYDH